jgi:hypothetical protein
MAQVAEQAQLRTKVDHYLDYLTAEWVAIPDLAAEWAEWDEDDRLDFVLEWPIREDRLLLQLRQWNATGLLTPQQRQRYAALQRLIRRQRPTLERLLAE